MMNIINVDEARSLSGFNTLTGARVAMRASRAIKQSAEKDDKTSISVEFQKFKLQKCSIKEARDILKDKGFKVDVTEDKGFVKLHISWFFSADKDMVLVY
ncbi:hypothetical protein [Alteromonas ponticola]|uniref:Uncharacterized protein n=1 Tax=Alteromonas ponticola TaxID=2720613 RepID=A0ABX1R2Z9_9ALTE|nr:hypothetical protein [Alteromonas ponticola]NMH60828.1 hypothetical protein [Alteromonas ponticola]